MSSPTAGRRIDILLVEDNADHVELILKAWGDDDVLNEVHVATDGEEALDFLYQRGEYADARRPALILLDIRMPKMNGIEVLKAIKSDETLKDIPVVMLTVSTLDKDVFDSFDYGCEQYVTKSIGFERFEETIEPIVKYYMRD